MLNKSINLQKEVRIDENRIVAFLNSQISSGYGTINFTIQVIDKEYVITNPEILKVEYDTFMEEMKNEAIANGWLALKEEETETVDTYEIIN